MVEGVEPRAGERVWLTRAVCYQIHGSGWFLVERVEAAYVPDCCYLHGRHFRDGPGHHHRLYVATARLLVERAVPGMG